MVLKKLEDALTDGDTIRAVMRVNGTNQDGESVLICLRVRANANITAGISWSP